MPMHKHAERLLNVDLLGDEDLEDMRKSVKIFVKSYDSSAYEDIKTQLDEGHNLSNEDRANLYVRFCNKWRCRIEDKEKQGFAILLPSVERQVGRIRKSLEQIERQDFKQILKPFDQLISIDGIGSTTASKILSLARPELYVMCDQAILWELGYSNSSAGYLRYLILMVDIAHRMRLIARKAGKRNLEQYLEPGVRKSPAPIAVYLDEWNWVNISAPISRSR